MNTPHLFESIERIAALMRAEERRRCAEFGLQPVHLQLLDYLLICNQYSNTPAAVSKYLGMTRGTVSQSLLLLEKKGLIIKTSDSHDKRVVHLQISAAGKALLNQAKPLDLFQQASKLLEKENNADECETFFVQALKALQKANRSNSFGLCKTCKHFDKQELGAMCRLTKGSLTQADSEKICQEHTLM
jgi:MarR family transcriptional regulator, negative regulator of the multidrug operon emrRAB